MADSGSRIQASSEQPALRGGNWDYAGGMDQITVVRIDDSHIAGEPSHGGGKAKADAPQYYEVEYSLPAEDEPAAEDEDDGVYVIEYSNPEEEGESYQFTMSVDRSLPAKKPAVKRENAAPSRPQRPRHKVSQRRRLLEEARLRKEAAAVSNKSVLALGDHSDIMAMNSAAGRKTLMCSLCPPPGKLFKRASGLAVHLKQMHHTEGRKTFFCSTCQQSVRTQVELDAHTKRHANQEAVFTCRLCAAGPAGQTGQTGQTGYSGSRWGLRRHMQKTHAGVVPRCDVCSRGFKTIASYLADQFRHVGVTPYYCAKCRIYEMTERGLSVHIRNHSRKKEEEVEKEVSESGGNAPPTFGAAADNSATDDSDF
ncbi:zinc finger protein 568 isoform X2 [Brachyistius frenatus]|uniref:zinc finger protein 568 isoform X2 n=1 Tax=Brachyistius frenatus TaxID=100188 RepID=UPI0037E8BA52